MILLTDNKIKAAFDAVRADDSIKENTKQYIHLAAEKRIKRRPAKIQRYVFVPICLLAVFAVCYGIFSYNIEVSAVSIDINPSIELGLNQYDRVINVRTYNDDGERVASSVNVNNLSCEKAVEIIADCGELQPYIEQGVPLVITVASQNNSDGIISSIEACSDSNIECHKSNSENIDEAHSHGMSLGKYNAYLKLKECDPEITAEEASGMTMGEIKRKIQDCGAEAETSGGNGNNCDSGASGDGTLTGGGNCAAGGHGQGNGSGKHGKNHN